MILIEFVKHLSRSLNLWKFENYRFSIVLILEYIETLCWEQLKLTPSTYIKYVMVVYLCSD